MFVFKLPKVSIFVFAQLACTLVFGAGAELNIALGCPAFWISGIPDFSNGQDYPGHARAYRKRRNCHDYN
jgi:hypothetical protein